MKLDYDKEVDVLYFQFLNEKASETEEVEPGIIVDFTKDGRVLGIEILNASKRLLVMESIKDLIDKMKLQAAAQDGNQEKK